MMGMIATRTRGMTGANATAIGIIVEIETSIGRGEIEAGKRIARRKMMRRR
jgi:hypothetical protein